VAAVGWGYGSRATSTKTRIETVSGRGVRERNGQVPERHPRKQGLKQIIKAGAPDAPPEFQSDIHENKD